MSRIGCGREGKVTEEVLAGKAVDRGILGRGQSRANDRRREGESAQAQQAR